MQDCLVGYLGRLYDASDLRNRRAILELCLPAPGGRLLDLGCAHGAFTVELGSRTRAAELYGIEFIDELAAQAAKRGVQVASSNLNEPFPFESERFDVVHSNQVIEHLENTDSFLKEIRRVLKPDGYTVISTNNLASWHNIFSLVLGMQPMPCHVSDERRVGNRFDPHRGVKEVNKGSSHFRIFSYGALYELLEHHGFAIDAFGTSGYYPFPPRLADTLCRIDRRHGAYLVARARPAAA